MLDYNDDITYKEEEDKMRSRIVSLCLCVLAVSITILMTVELINSEKQAPSVFKPQNKEEQQTIDKGKTPTAPMPEIDPKDPDSRAYFAGRVEKFVDTLAYGDKKSFDELDYIIDNLDKMSEYFATTEMGDKAGSEYFATLSQCFKTAKDGFVSDSDFSIKVSAMLSNIDSAASKLEDPTQEHYPTIATDVNSATTLAMLAIYEKQSASSDGSTFTVTVGGGSLIGDKLSTTESQRFATQLKNCKYVYPFYAISAVTANDDMTLTALEAPLTTATASTSNNPVKGAPEYAKSLLGIDAVSLASKSVMEYGEEGFNETVKALRDNGVSCSVQESSQYVDSEFGKIVYITFDITGNPVTEAQNQENVTKVKEAVLRERESGADLVIVQIHWDTRVRKGYDDYATPFITSDYEQHFDRYNLLIARSAIDNGADLVVGYGSRVTQGIESYNDKFIVYETGDLTYSGSVDSTMNNTDCGFLFRQTFAKDANGSVRSLSYRLMPIVNTSEDNLYVPQLVFDERADEIIETVLDQSKYFSNALKSFNYIKITK